MSYGNYVQGSVDTTNNGYNLLISGAPSGYTQSGLMIGGDTATTYGVRVSKDATNNAFVDLRGDASNALGFRYKDNTSGTVTSMLSLSNDADLTGAGYGATVNGRVNASAYYVGQADTRAPANAGVYMAMDGSNVGKFSINKGTGTGGFQFNTYNANGTLAQSNLNLLASGVVQAAYYTASGNAADSESVAVAGLDANGNLIRNYAANARFRAVEARLTALETDLVGNVPAKVNEIVTRLNGLNFFSQNIATIASFAPAPPVAPVVRTPYSVTYLLVGGGGGGGASQAAGGGGGEVNTDTMTIYPGDTLNIFVGSGGAGGAFSSSGAGTNGQNTTLNSLVAYGGGGGGGGAPNINGKDGGNGGGSFAGGNHGNPFRSRGYAGGDGATDNFNYESGGGGGGGGGVGGNATGTYPNVKGGNGGVGAITTIISTSIATAQSVGQVVGSSVYFAGGGGGATNKVGGDGGYGGGGIGGNTHTTAKPITDAGNGTTNTGGGGGGGEYPEGVSTGNGGNGGSGVAILSMPTASYSGTQTGATVVTNGSNTILIWKSGSGSYTV